MTGKTFNIPEGAAPSLKEAWAKLPNQYAFLEKMKFDQSTRGEEGYMKRAAHRAATHKTWAQMKGLERVMYEIKHPGNLPFVYGFAITSTICTYMYMTAQTDEHKAASTYYQRFHAKADGWVNPYEKKDGH